MECNHDFRGVSYGNGPVKECRSCGHQEPFLEDKIEQQRSHELYKRREQLYSEARELQLVKGAEKYPEPLNPDSWSAAELGSHSMQEIVDQGSYTTALVIKCERLEARVKELEQLLKDQAQAADRARRKAYLYGR